MTGTTPSPRMALLEVTTVGLPFCAFKVLAGLSLAGSGPLPLRVLGGALAALGVADAAVNLLNAGTLFTAGRRLSGTCIFSMASKAIGRGSNHPQWAWREFGTALDVMLSFSLVALMILGDRLRLLPSRQMACWSAAVVLNVLGAGLGRLTGSFKNFAATGLSVD